LVSAEALRGGGGADSFVQFPLEKSSRKVYNYSTIFIRICQWQILGTQRVRIRGAPRFRVGARRVPPPAPKPCNLTMLNKESNHEPQRNARITDIRCS